MKKIFSILLSALLVAGLLTGCSDNSGDDTTSTVTADPAYTDTIRDLPKEEYLTPAESFAGGSGTESDPYQIADASQLVLLAEKTADEELTVAYEYAEAHYVLIADIALNDISDFANWSKNGPEYQWKPIGTHVGLKGVFDGAGHTVSGLYINTNSENESDKYGLFDSIEGGTIKNLTLEKSYIAVSGKSTYVGGIVGNIVGGKENLIENCTVNADIYCYTGTYGGIVGSMGNSIIGDENPDYLDMPTVNKCTFAGTITQVKTPCMNYIGGIVGNSDGYIRDCENKGTISFASDNVDYVGGIAGAVGAGEISNCVNSGKLECEKREEGFATSGGIVGSILQSATGGEEYMSRGVTVSGCSNSGVVQGTLYAGGIVGKANNDHNDWCLTVSACVNTGAVSGAKYNGGVVGYLASTADPDNGNNVCIEKCENKADIKDGTPGGIIGQFFSEKGNILIQDCTNTGNLTTTEQNAGGIIGYWLMNSEPEDTVTVKNCVNSGNISSALNAGGIVSYMDVPVLTKKGENTNINVVGCTNSGNLTVSSTNGYVGGILGNWGLKNIPTLIENCTNSGEMSITAVIKENDVQDGEAAMTVSRIVGGIVGRVGSGLLLTTDNDKIDSSYIQSDDAVLVLKGCSNKGKAVLADDREGEFGDAVFRNYLGGIIGNASATEGYSLRVENCTYTEFGRGLGNSELSDVGTKQ